MAGRKPRYYFMVQFTRVRDVDEQLLFRVTDILIIHEDQLTRDRERELIKDDYSKVAGPVSKARCWLLKRQWKLGNLMTKKER